MNIFEIDKYVTNYFDTYTTNDLCEELENWILSKEYKTHASALLENPNPNIREYKDIVRRFVPYDILRHIVFNQEATRLPDSVHLCERCENRDDFTSNGSEIGCGKCCSVIIQYKVDNYDPRYRCVSKLDNSSIHFRNIVRNYAYKTPQRDIIQIEDRLLNDFNDFRKAYNELDTTKKYFISHELVLYVILRRNNIECKMSEFTSLKTCHIGVCSNVLEKLGWDLPKETMEGLQNCIINPQTRQKQVNKCIYVLKKGDRQGQECGNRCKSHFCSKHAKRMDTEEN